MKKKHIVLVIALFILTVALLSIFNPKLRFYYYIGQWQLNKPNIYSMDVKVKNEKNGTRTWQVVIEDDKLIKITPEPDYLYFAWFGQYDLTVESIFRFGNDFCFAYHECLIKINSEYLFPEVLVYPPTGIVVENFQVCETLDRCVLGE